MGFPARQFCVLIAVLGCASCKRESTITVPAPARATTQPSTRAARPIVVPRVRTALLIDGVEISFPAMQLRVTDPGTGAAATLSTVPTSDVDENTLRLDMALPDADPAEFSNAEWHFKTDDPERAVTLNAILLNGGDVELQPADLKVTFIRDGEGWVVSIDGECFLYEGPDALAPKRRVVVSGRVKANAP